MEKKLYKVGGCVRDTLLGINSSDIDWLAVGFTEDDFKDLEKVGKDFPVFLNENNEEIALARVERKCGHGYNDFTSNIKNVTLEEDLKRRDLTINSIAYDVQNDVYIDPYNGISDIENKILKHTSVSFIEDPVRVLRLARFQTKFTDFSIDNSTINLVLSMKDELKYLQKDRVYKEIKKVFVLENYEKFFEALLELNVLKELFPVIYTLVANKRFKDTIYLLKKVSKYSTLLKYTSLYVECYKTSFDINLPIKLQKRIQLLINNKNILYELENIKLDEIELFFKSYRKDKILFIEQIKFNSIYNPSKVINENLLLEIFDKILKYSPKDWIDKQKVLPKANEIKEHIHQVNIEIISYNLFHV